jgi:hypothetical protein
MEPELVRWMQAFATSFGIAMNEKGRPAIDALGHDPEDWDTELDEAGTKDSTRCYSLITFKGSYPATIQHIYRCWNCGKYERPWKEPARCECWLKYDPEVREMRHSEDPPRGQP